MALKNPIVFHTTFSTYTATDIIGEGGSGRIYKATDNSGKAVALKLLSSSKLSSENLRRFKNEIFFCVRNKHPNIVTILDHGIFLNKDQNIPFYVMPLYTCSLRNLLRSGIPPDDVLPYFTQFLDGVEAAHLQKVVHRDLKPENVLYDESKNLFSIADFGIAQFQEEELYTAVETSDSTRLANFQYAAPEQRGRGQLVDHRSDIYALGLILNEMFTNQVPYGTSYKTIGSIAPSYAYLDDLNSTTLRQSPAERPSSIEVIKQELIRRKNKFITLQKISQLQDTVIHASDIDDPLVLDPIRLVNLDWDRDVLTLTLNQPVNQKWLNAFYSIGNYQSLLGKEPGAFKFKDNKAMIPATENEVQKIIDYFKSWLPAANRDYENNLRRELKQGEEAKRRQIEQEAKLQEARQRVLRNTEI